MSRGAQLNLAIELKQKITKKKKNYISNLIKRSDHIFISSFIWSLSQKLVRSTARKFRLQDDHFDMIRKYYEKQEIRNAWKLIYKESMKHCLPIESNIVPNVNCRPPEINKNKKRFISWSNINNNSRKKLLGLSHWGKLQ